MLGSVLVPFLVQHSSCWVCYFACDVVSVVCLFLVVAWVGLQYVIVAIPSSELIKHIYAQVARA